jgi:hypothetical protein
MVERLKEHIHVWAHGVPGKTPPCVACGFRRGNAEDARQEAIERLLDAEFVREWGTK